MKRNVMTMVYGSVITSLMFMLLAAPATAENRNLVLKRIQPVAQVYVDGMTVPVAVQQEPVAVAASSEEHQAPAASAAPAEPRDGETVYRSACFACHDTGAAGAPMLGNKEAWASRIAQGMDALLLTAINGKGVMPPRGTCGACSDDELKAAVEFMVSKAE